MKNELVSIIMPTYNRAYLIKRSIDSLLKQTYKNIEIIIVDDASTDDTEDIVKKVDDKRIKYYKLEKNSGACYARNFGIKKSNGNYITFQDSDDEYLENKIEEQYNNLIKNKSDFDFCITKITNKKGEFFVPSDDRINEFNKNGVFSELHKGNFISTQTMLVKREIMLENLFDESLPRLQDFDLALRLSEKYKSSFTNKHLCNCYVQNDSISSSTEKFINAVNLILAKDYNSNNEDKFILVQNLLHSCIYMTNNEISEEKDRILKDTINNKDDEINDLNKKITDLNKSYKSIAKENKKVNKLYKELETSYIELNNNYSNIINSKRWKMANKIFNFIEK